MKSLHTISFILLVVGGLNWGIVGLIGVNYIDLLGEFVARIIYVLVGLSAILELVSHKKSCNSCKVHSGGGSSSPAPESTGGSNPQM